MTHSKRKIAIVAAAILLMLAATAMVVFEMFSNTTISFREGNQITQNPGQGFYVQLDTKDHDRIKDVRQDGIRLILLTYNLNGYQKQPLDEEKLLELDTALDAAAAQNMHIIFRAAYGFLEGGATVEPQKASLILEHIGQIAPALNRHANRIVCVQAGMLGPWGEWHSSRFLKGSDAAQVDIRNRVADTWLKALEPSIPLQLRRPLFIRQAVEAGMPLERFGLHNDALLGSETDLGTYSSHTSRETELQWVRRYLPYGRNGGEMPAVSEFTEADNAVREFRMLSLTYLNSRYNVEVLNGWDTQIYKGVNARDYISGHLGSRLYLLSAQAPRRMTKRGSGALTLTLSNTGFAPPRPDLRCYLAVRQDSVVTYHPMGDMGSHIGKGGDVKLVCRLDGLLDLEPEVEFEFGVWIGYGHPGQGGAPYLLANDQNGVAQDEDALYFSDYVPNSAGWKHVRTNSP